MSSPLLLNPIAIPLQTVGFDVQTGVGEVLLWMGIQEVTVPTWLGKILSSKKARGLRRGFCTKY